MAVGSLGFPQREGSALPKTALGMNHLALNDLLTGEIQAGLEIWGETRALFKPGS